METTNTLAGHLLVAMPTMVDPNFDHTVTYVCEHSTEGALGLTINRPMNMDLGEVLEQLDLENKASSMSAQPVLRGGPVQMERGFILHESLKDWENTTAVSQSIFVTTSQDILLDLAAGRGPNRILMALGYAGWGAGQLEEEIRQNTWLTVPASIELLFETPFEQRWRAAAQSIGIDPVNLSTHAGNA